MFVSDLDHEKDKGKWYQNHNHNINSWNTTYISIIYFFFSHLCDNICVCYRRVLVQNCRTDCASCRKLHVESCCKRLYRRRALWRWNSDSFFLRFVRRFCFFLCDSFSIICWEQAFLAICLTMKPTRWSFTFTGINLGKEKVHVYRNVWQMVCLRWTTNYK